MTERARDVLDTVRYAHDKYEANPPSGQDWVLHWTATVALLRAVGHALDKVDANRSPAHKEAIDGAWKAWSEMKGENEDEHKIFWLFIEDDRNSILKEFELHAGQGVIVHPGDVPNQKTYPFMGDEMFSEKTQPEMVQEAIEWWDTQLSRIEASIASSLSP